MRYAALLAALCLSVSSLAAQTPALSQKAHVIRTQAKKNGKAKKPRKTRKKNPKAN